MRVWHPEHGYHHAFSDLEFTELQKHGWEIDKLTIQERKALKKPEATDDAMAPQSLDSVRKMWELKFGKKPHHMIKIEKLLKDLE